jgi:putative membrane protein
MRWMRLASIRIETAGGSGKESQDAAKTVSSRWFVPVLPESRVPEIMAQLRPGLAWNEEAFDWKSISPRAHIRLSRLAVLGSLLIGLAGFAATRPWGWTLGVAALPVLVFLAFKKSRSKRYARTNDCVVYRSGIFTHRTSVTFFEKIQTVRLDESPFDRRWRMASLCIDTAAAGPADHRIHIRYLTGDFARREFDEIVRQTSEQLPVFG